MNITIAGYGFVGKSHGTKMGEQKDIDLTILREAVNYNQKLK